jgi:hypothetical protein
MMTPAAEVMAAELEHLVELSQQPNVVLQVVREPAYFPGHDGAFAIASGRAIPDTLNMVNIEDHTTNAAALVDRAIALFEDIRGYALTVAESRSLSRRRSSGGGTSCEFRWRKSSYSNGGMDNCVEVGAIPWRKSTYSDNGGSDCVEAGQVPGAVLIRDAKDNGNGLVLRICARTWLRFIAALR